MITLLLPLLLLLLLPLLLLLLLPLFAMAATAMAAAAMAAFAMAAAAAAVEFGLHSSDASFLRQLVPVYQLRIHLLSNLCAIL